MQPGKSVNTSCALEDNLTCDRVAESYRSKVTIACSVETRLETQSSVFEHTETFRTAYLIGERHNSER